MSVSRHNSVAAVPIFHVRNNSYKHAS